MSKLGIHTLHYCIQTLLLAAKSCGPSEQESNKEIPIWLGEKFRSSPLHQSTPSKCKCNKQDILSKNFKRILATYQIVCQESVMKRYTIPRTKSGQENLGTQKSMILKANSGECCATHNFVLLVMFTWFCTLQCTKWNRFWKDKCWHKFRYSCIHQNNLIDMEALRNIDIPLVSSLLPLKRFHIFSQYFLAEFEEVLLTAFTSRDQSTDK